MYNPLPQKIYLRKTRDFGQVFGASFGYIREHFKQFYGSILLLAGPFALLSGLAISYFMSGAFKGMYSGVAVAPTFNGFWLPYIGVILSGMLGNTVFGTVLNQHLILNEQMGPQQKPVVADIARSFFSVYWRNLLAWLLFLVVAIVGVIALALIIGGLVWVIAAINGVLGVLFGILLYIFFLFILVPYISFIIINSFFVIQRDKIGLFEAIRKVGGYVRGNFWMTWLLSLVALAISYFGMFICMLPVYILMIVTAVSRIPQADTLGAQGGSDFSLLSYVLWCISSLLLFVVLSFYHLMCSFQYNHLEEKKDGKNILDKINAI